MSNFINLDQAIIMTSLYRIQKEKIVADPFKDKNILSVCETFDAESFQTVLNQSGCKSIRIYYGMSDDLRVHAIIVGVNEKGEDMLPDANSANQPLINSVSYTQTTAQIIEQGAICPPVCPPRSPLNP